MGKQVDKKQPVTAARGHATRRAVVMGSGFTLVVAGAGVAAGSAPGAAAAPAALSAAPTQVPGSTPVATSETEDPLATFQAELLQQFPTNYGGFFENPDETYSVVVVGSDPTLESTAQQLFDRTPAEFGVSVPASTLKLTFVQGARSLASLYAIQDQVQASMTSSIKAGTAPAIIGVGVDQEHGQVVISSDGSPAGVSAAAAYATTYGAAVRTQVASIPTTDAGRTDDTAPWNSGDQIVNLPETTYCTLGFGVHNTSTGQHFSLTAGHCGTSTWYNTTHSSPTKNTSDKVGSTYAGSLSVPAPYTVGLDLQLIADSSSPLMWKGPIGTTTRTTITGYANPVTGASVCLEGSVGGEACGTVSTAGKTAVVTNDGTEYTVEDIFITDAAAKPGDSGGPVLYPSIFGPLAGGMIEAAHGTGTTSEEIDALLYVESVEQGASVTVNTGSTP